MNKEKIKKTKLNKDYPLISVIVPIYNVEQLLSYCLNSIINQSYRNLEIILIDDGSKDDSGNICNNYKDKDDRIIVLHKENEGQAQARNDGLKIASGKFLTFVDSDDVLEPDYYEQMLKLIIENDCDLSICMFDKIYDFNKIEHSKKDEIINIFCDDQILKEYFKPIGNYNFYHNIWNKLYKSFLFDGISFKKGIVHDDFDIMYQVLDKCKKVAMTNKIYYHYYKKNKNSITNNFNSFHTQCSVDIIENILNNFKHRKSVKSEMYFFCKRQLIQTYEQSRQFHDTKTKKIERKIIKDILICIFNSFDDFGENIKIFARLIFPKMHKTYSMMVNKK